MEWFTIENSTGKQIGNIYPQTEFMSPGYDLHKTNSVWNIQLCEIPNFEPDLDYFILHKKAKLTDVISTGFITSSGFLINDKVKAFFEQFNLPTHKYYPAKIMHKNTLHLNYFWVQFGEDNSNLIDFKNSQFELKDPLPFFQDEIVIISNSQESDVLEIKKQNIDKKLFPIKIKLKTNIKYSLLSFSFFWNNFYIDSNFKNQLIKNNITGFEIKESNLSIEF